ncbi:MAG: flagellar assembly protein H, partial [Microcystaceae cyanobacterium]
PRLIEKLRNSVVSRLLVYDLLAVLEVRQQTEQDLDEDDWELIMKLSPIYRQRLEEATQQGRQEGKQQERRAIIESLLQIRFGSIDEELQAIINPLIGLEAEEFTPNLLQLSREELLTRFSH